MIAPQQLPAVTAVISTHNRRDELEITLTRLRQLGVPNLQIIVVDNASDDGTASLVRADFPRVTLLPHSDNRPMRGYNMGFEAALTPYVLVLDDDSCPRRGTIERMLEFLEDHPDVGAVAANILGPDGQSEWNTEDNTAFSTDFFNLIGCGFLARRSVLAQTEGYDEAFGLYYNDLELALRILSFGHRIAYDPDAIVEHRKGRAAPSPLKYRLMLRNFSLLVRSHFSGLRRMDLILGHAAIALWYATKDRRLPAALRGLKESFRVSSPRPFLSMPDSLAARRFSHRYSLWSHLLRKRAPFSAPSAALLAPPVPLQRVPPPPNESPLPPDGDDVLSWYGSLWKDYKWHLKHLSYLPPADRRARAQQATAWFYRPLVSILTPVYKTNPAHLTECLLSIERQLYPNWELCIVDDGSNVPELRRAIESFAARHPGQVHFVSRAENRGIARTSQEALELATGEFIALLDHDDRLAPEALWECVARLNLHPDLDWLYGDYDKISPNGNRHFYYFKPDWSPDLLLSYCYPLHLSVLRRSLVEHVGGFRADFNGAQDYDLFLRLAEQTNRVHHVPRILYSWRQSQDSTSQNPESKPYSYESGRRAIDDALRRRGDNGTCEYVTGALVWDGVYQIRRPHPSAPVDLLVLGDPAMATAAANRWHPSAPDIVFANTFLPEPGEHAGATLARALLQAQSPYLLIVDAHSSPLSDNALTRLLQGMAPRGLGILAPKIVSPDGSVDHCGLSLAPGGQLVFPLRGQPSSDPAYGAYGVVVRNVAAVSPITAIANVRLLRDSFSPAPDMDAPGAILAACLDLRTQGFRVAVDGSIQVLHNSTPFAPGPALEPGGRDHVQLTQRHPTLFVGGDPFYNRNLRTSPPDFGVWHEAHHA